MIAELLKIAGALFLFLVSISWIFDQGNRTCYCPEWKDKPRQTGDKTIPETSCGKCDVCGKPGHVSHYPGAVPATGSWCDVCYKKMQWTTPQVYIPRAVAFVIAVCLSVSAFRHLRLFH